MRPDHPLLSDPLTDLTSDESPVVSKRMPEPTALQRAAGTGDRVQVRRELDAGADPDAAHYELAPRPLHLAARQNATDIVDMLVAAGADIEAVTVDGETPLMIAARYRQHAAARRLLHHGATRKRGTELYVVHNDEEVAD
jgi:hypothetical protein